MDCATSVPLCTLLTLTKRNKRAMALEASEQNMRASEAGEAISNHK